MAIETHADAIMLRWTPEKEDLRELARRPAYRRQMVKPMAVATILLAVGLILKLTVLAVVGGVLLLLLGLLSGRARQLRWNNDPLVQDPVEYVADKRGLSRRQQEFECWWGWSRIRDVEESSRAFILRLGIGRPSDGPFLILPKRGLASAADETRLRELLDAQVRRRQTS
ncbi:YcxB family protein [Kribbella sp. NBC_00889]|uniref:YcxB family protein n=1 Tax=Kribbella sp. NBC_00889 TaxID=2975974 RepID=UPI00386DDE1F|nr:YcxB family protein [Kribbella sp. NBC_00889]